MRHSLLIANRPLPKSHPRNRPSGASPKTARAPVPGWLWLVAGLAGGALIMALINLASGPEASAKTSQTLEAAETIDAANTIEKSRKQEKSIEKSVDKTPKESTEPTAAAKPTTKFDFYTLLPEQEVIEPNERPAPAASKTDTTQKPQQPAAAVSGEEFNLQAGSFRSAAEADKRRAQVQSLGLPSRQESVSAGGDTWYRVLVGPFPSRDAVTQARDKLAAQDIDTIVVRKKKLN